MKKDGGVQAECLLLEPLTISLSMQRNLSAAWYHDNPDIELTGALEPLTVSLYSSVMWHVRFVCVCVWLCASACVCVYVCSYV